MLFHTRRRNVEPRLVDSTSSLLTSNWLKTKNANSHNSGRCDPGTEKTSNEGGISNVGRLDRLQDELSKNLYTQVGMGLMERKVL
jgi:hypothetical protein